MVLRNVSHRLHGFLGFAPKKIDFSSGVRIEIAAVAALLRNDIWGLFLSAKRLKGSG